VIASLLALTPAILRGRERWTRAACAQNLQNVGVKLQQYAATQNEFPFVSPDGQVTHGGAILCRLKEKGIPIGPRDLHCPCNGADLSNADSYPDEATMRHLLNRSPEKAHQLLPADYAFHAGYRLPTGKPGPLPARPVASVPLIADRPPYDNTGMILEGNSPNHRGRGQNVLYADGHVVWQTNRWVSPRDADLYLNNENRLSYGVSPEDSVLVPAVLPVSAR
jgi:prepilin-type processing-associated H-X9-DG protein